MRNNKEETIQIFSEIQYNKNVKEKVIALLQELIRNKCVNDGTDQSGHETRSAHSIEQFFKSYGIESEILEALPGRGSIIARIPGTDPDAPSLMFMGHLDVVPANPEEWSCDPFGAEIREGYVWGRGAVDMLNITAASAVAFAEIVKKHGPFPGDLIFLGEADEEASGRLGARWLVEKHWEKVKADNIITEGGGFIIPGTKGSGIAIAVGEKGLAFTKLYTQGKPGHGSLPYQADNAVTKAAKGICRIENSPPKIIFTEAYRNMTGALTEGALLKAALNSPLTLPGALKKLYKRNPGLAKQLHAISRMTISPNVITGGNKINIIADKAEIDLDARILPEQTIEDVINEISRALGDLKEEFSIEVIDFFPSNISSLNTPLMEATKELSGEIYPDKNCIPMLFSGVTDARFWRMKGATVYGFCLPDEELTLSEYTRGLHGVDERISLKSLELTVDYFYRLPETFFRHI